MDSCRWRRVWTARRRRHPWRPGHSGSTSQPGTSSQAGGRVQERGRDYSAVTGVLQLYRSRGKTMSIASSESRGPAVRSWIACLVSALLASGITAVMLVAVPRFGWMPVRSRPIAAAPARTQRGEVTIYELFGCSQQLNECERYARVLPVRGPGVVPNRFPTLTLCQEYSSKYVGSPPNRAGRWQGRPGKWLQCFARRTFPWYPADGM